MRDLYDSKGWKTLVSIALCTLVAVIVLEHMFPDHALRIFLTFLDFCAIGILAANLAIGYYHATYKDIFLKQHVLELIALMPLWGMLRLAEYDYLALRLFRTTSHFGVFEDAGLLFDALRYKIT